MLAKYAVLISTGDTIADDLWTHSEYWYDLLLMYRTLIENGFTHENIFVLYGFGNDFVSTHADYITATHFPNIPQITNYPVSDQDIMNIFTWLANGNAAENIPAITNNDFLFVWWMGHGTDVSPTQVDFDIATTGESISDITLAGYIDLIANYLKRGIFIMTCNSGGAIEDLEGIRSVVQTSSPIGALSFSDTYDVVHAEFTYHLACALREETAGGVAVASDADTNNLVSLDEAFTHISGQPMSSTPQMSDLSNIAPCIFISVPTPGKDIEIMSRDHENDRGATPSNDEIWYNGPDLWVRINSDGFTEHQDPEYGQTNYIYANIHNIGCSAVTSITVDFSWCEQSAWANPLLWNHIDSVTIPVLLQLESRTVMISWSDLPLPGKYCLHTRISCREDHYNNHGEAYLDNNKVQINVAVEDTAWGLQQSFVFFIENAQEKEAPFDIIIDAREILPGAELVLELPSSLKFKDTVNAKMVKLSSGRSKLFLENTRSIIKGVSLAPSSLDRQRLVMSIKTPSRAKLGQKSIVTIEERVKDRSRGGIQFVTPISKIDKIWEKLLRRKINLFRGIAQDLSIPEAIAITRVLSRKMKADLDDWDSFMKIMRELVVMETDFLKKVFLSKQYKLSELIDSYFYDRYKTALDGLRDAISKNNRLRTIEWGFETVLFLGVIVSDFIQLKKIRLLKRAKIDK